MNYYLTQEQYEQLRAIADGVELFIDYKRLEQSAALDELIAQIGNQKASDLV